MTYIPRQEPRSGISGIVRYDQVPAMTLREAFKHQIETTRLLIDEDFGENHPLQPVVWNGVIFRPNGNYYSSGREMKAGEKLVIGYVVEETDTPTPILFEESELESYDNEFVVIRISSDVPVLQRREECQSQ